jgi:hypothetical protein
MKMSNGQAISQFFTKLQAQADVCDLANVGTNQLVALCMISKCIDPVMKNYFLKMDSELASVVKAYQTYETQTPPCLQKRVHVSMPSWHVPGEW